MHINMTPDIDPRIASLPSIAERNDFYDGLSDREIRRRQDLNQHQISIAKTEEQLEFLRIVEDDLMQAMMRRC